MLDFVSRTQLAKCLHLSERTIDRLKQSEGLPFHKFGGQYRFSLQEVKDWMDKRRENGKSDLL
jgi:excisionase family DNA binding protein